MRKHYNNFEEWCLALDAYARPRSLLRTEHIDPQVLERAYTAGMSPQEFLESIGPSAESAAK